MKSRSRFPDRLLGVSLLVLLIVFALFECTSIDLQVQDRLYDFTTHAWRVDAHAAVPRWLFYTGPKVLLIAFAVVLALGTFGPSRWRARVSPSLRRRDLGVVLMTLVSGPLLISALKASTDVYGPAQIRRYGGNAPYVRVLEKQPENDRPARPGKSFPAGHASGGFALLSLAGLSRELRWRWAGAATGLLAGVAMGGYQMLKGAHYLSHTVITALVCWILFLVWRRILNAGESNRGERDLARRNSSSDEAAHVATLSL